MPFSTVSEDVATGVMNAFIAHAEYVATVPGKIYLERPKSNPAPTLPYGVMSIRKGSRPPEYNTGNTYVDFRRVSITFYGSQDQVSDCLGLAEAVLTFKPLTIPNSTFLVCFPLPPAPMTQLDEFVLTKELRQAEDVWAATNDWDVWTQRTVQS